MGSTPVVSCFARGGRMSRAVDHSVRMAQLASSACASRISGTGQPQSDAVARGHEGLTACVRVIDAVARTCAVNSPPRSAHAAPGIPWRWTCRR